MAQEFAKSLYNSGAWKKCRASFIKAKGGLCEICYKKGLYVPGEIVHHKIHLTPENVNEPTITMNFDNLELLCRECHALQHGAHKGRRYIIDIQGNVIPKEV